MAWGGGVEAGTGVSQPRCVEIAELDPQQAYEYYTERGQSENFIKHLRPKKEGRGGRPRPSRAVVAGASPRHPKRTEGVRRDSLPQSLKLRITVGISRSLPKSFDAMGPNPPEPSGRVKPPLRKKGGS